MYLSADSKMLSGVSDIVHDVTNATNNDATPRGSVAGVVSAVLRFQGILLTDRGYLSPCTDRIFKKATDILNRGGTMDGAGGTQEEENTSIEME